MHNKSSVLHDVFVIDLNILIKVHKFTFILDNAKLYLLFMLHIHFLLTKVNYKLQMNNVLLRLTLN